MKRTGKIAAILLAMLLLGTQAVSAAVPSDVAGQPFEKAVQTLMDRDIITGDVDGLYHSYDTLTRAQVCTIVVKAMNAPLPRVNGTASQTVKKSGFGDMSGYGWAEGYIAWAVEKNVAKGYPDGTFQPGNNVSTNELITMVLRAAGYTDERLGGVWPDNYLQKAGELGALNGLPATLPEYASKWMAAQVVYNILGPIQTANPAPETPGQGTDEDEPSDAPDTGRYTYQSGQFNENLSTFAGNEIASNVKVYTCGLKKDYNSSMTLPGDASEYREETIYKYKNVETPAWFVKENGRITEIIVPRDSGFTGRAYVVINGTLKMTNFEGEEADGIETLTAGNPITWACRPGTSDIPGARDYQKGLVYELQIMNGEVRNIALSTDAKKIEPAFAELTNGFTAVEAYSNSVVTIDGEVVAVNPSASVYVLDNAGEYSFGSIGNVRRNAQVRIYDVSDDDEKSADVIIVQR